MKKEEDGFPLLRRTNIKTIESQTVKLTENYDNGYAIYVARQIAHSAGFSITDEIMIATAASELATNIIRYAKKGEIVISIIVDLALSRKGVEIYASDSGPGIKDIELAMQEKYSTMNNSLGLGLPSVKRIMEEFYIESVMGKGTRILTRKWI